MSKRVHRRGWSCIPCAIYRPDRLWGFAVTEAAVKHARVVCCSRATIHVGIFYVHFIAEWMLYRQAYHETKRVRQVKYISNDRTLLYV
jgi:hypothetical protein